MTKDEAMHPSTHTVRMSGADIHLIEWGAAPPVCSSTAIRTAASCGKASPSALRRIVAASRRISRLRPFGSAGRLRTFARRPGAIRRTIPGRRRDWATGGSRGARFRRPVCSLRARCATSALRISFLLARQTRDVWVGAANRLALDDRGLSSGPAHVPSGQLAAAPAAEDKNVILFGLRHVLSPAIHE